MTHRYLGRRKYWSNGIKSKSLTDPFVGFRYELTHRTELCFYTCGVLADRGYLGHRDILCLRLQKSDGISREGNLLPELVSDDVFVQAFVDGKIGNGVNPSEGDIGVAETLDESLGFELSERVSDDRVDLPSVADALHAVTELWIRG